MTACRKVLDELPQTRKDLGYPPLVTPTSQIVGIQAVQNVLFGRYEMVSQQVKDYAFGLYGQPPLPMDKGVQRAALKGYERGQRPTKRRPADVLEPEMDGAREATKDIAKNDGDVLIYALYPVTGLRFLRWKYGLEEPPPEVMPDYRPPQAADAAASAAPPADVSPAARTFNVHVGTERFPGCRGSGRWRIGAARPTVIPTDAGSARCSAASAGGRLPNDILGQRAGGRRPADCADARSCDSPRS